MLNYTTFKTFWLKGVIIMNIKAVSSFNSKQIAKDIVNVLANYGVSVSATDIIFEAVKEELALQRVQKILTED